VLAGSISSVIAEQGKALEYYLRSGGTLVFLEKEVANTGFLAAYRQGPPRPEPVVVGRGRLYRLPSLEANGLGKVFRPNPLSQAMWFPQFGGRRSPVQVAL